MTVYIVNRLLQAVPVLVLVSIIVFAVVRLVPGDAAEAAAGEDAPPERVAEIRAALGLDRPIPVQYLDWVTGALRGDLGTSLQRGIPVRRLLELSIPPTVELAAVAFPLAVIIGVPLGAVAGMRPGSPFDAVASAFSITAIALPGFVIASLLLWLFAVELNWLPAAGRVAILSNPLEGLRTALLPALALAIDRAAVLTRYTRTAVATVGRQDFVRTARAKGLAESAVLWRHALRNALLPVITISALQLGQLLSGAVVVEQVFTRPGMGREMVTAVLARDYPVVQGGLLVLVASFILVNLAADIAYAVIDPRVRQR
jgi:peptide/nickel transport system permease protein